MNTSPKKCILLNSGSVTRKPFHEGIPGIPSERYRTKELLLHLDGNGGITFLDRGESISFTDSFVFIRLRATDSHFCGMLAEYLAHHDIPTNDPIHLSYPYSAEKISQMLKLSLAHICIPETFIFREESFEKNKEYIEAHLHFPAVFKTDGSKGRNVKRIENMEELETLVKVKRPYRLCLVQTFIENSFDTRTIVGFGEVLGSISRTRTNGHLNNIAQGAVPSRYELTETEKDIAIRAAEVCGIDIAGVDMIHTDTGPIVLEVNKSPQVGGFESVHDFKVFTRVAELIRKKYGF